jgi:lysophospholipase L1-like esterase
MNSTRIVASIAEASADLKENDPGPDWVVVLAGVNNTRWLGQSGRFCLDEGTPRARAPRLVRASRTYKVLTHLVLRGRPPRPADLACRAVADGFQHLDEGRPDLAEPRFEAARRALPASRWAHVGSGIAAGRMGRHGRAVEHFEAAGGLGRLSPALPLAHAFALRNAARGGEARRVLAAMGSSDGDLREATELLAAHLAADEGLWDEAEERFRALAAGRPGVPAGGGVVPFALNGVGWTQLARGDHAGAAETFKAADRAGAPIHVTPHLLGWAHLGEAVAGVALGESLETTVSKLEVARRDSSAAGTALAIEALLRAESSCEEAVGPLEASRAVVDTPLGQIVAARCSTSPRISEASRYLFGEGAETLRPMPTPAVQQWFDPTDTSLVVRDLEEALARAEALGARAILVTYPQPRAHDEIAEAVLALGVRTGTPVVDPRGAFDEAHAGGRPWSDLLIPDGHPTAEGYRIVGELLAEAVLGRPLNTSAGAGSL